MTSLPKRITFIKAELEALMDEAREQAHFDVLKHVARAYIDMRSAEQEEAYLEHGLAQQHI